MRYKELGQSGISASIIGLGGWAIGGWFWGGTDRREAGAAIQCALDKGVNFIDTAPLYGFGVSEQIIGKAVAGHRDEVILATKCGLIWHEQKGDFFFNADDRTITRSDHDRSVFKYLEPDSIRRELEKSLKHLGTDYIDLYQTNWPDMTTPIEDTMATLLDLKQQGKIRAIGVCNVTPAQLVTYAGVGPVDAVQVKYSMIDHEPERDLMPYSHTSEISVLAYSPLSRGLLTGKINGDRKFGDGDGRWQQPRYSMENRRRVLAMLKEIEPVAREIELTLAQLVLAWTIAQPGVTHALVGMRGPSQAVENAQAAQVFLAAEQMSRIDQAIYHWANEIE